MKRGPQLRKVRLSDSTRQQLNMYALAAGAAGVSLLALTPPADARIVYTRANKYLINGNLNVDLNNDGITDFTLEDIYQSRGSFSGSCFVGQQISVGPNTNSMNGDIFSVTGNAAALPAGASIGPSDKFANLKYGNQMGIVFKSYRCSNPQSTRFYGSGPWINVNKAYLGLRFVINGQLHYGWVRLNVHDSTNKKKFIVAHETGYAYETIANHSIIAGKTSGQDSIGRRRPANLGRLARGKSIIRSWRGAQEETRK